MICIYLTSFSFSLDFISIPWNFVIFSLLLVYLNFYSAKSYLGKVIWFTSYFSQKFSQQKFITSVPFIYIYVPNTVLCKKIFHTVIAHSVKLVFRKYISHIYSHNIKSIKSKRWKSILFSTKDMIYVYCYYKYIYRWIFLRSWRSAT